ncbi:MAG: hypothetical protein AAF721_00390 [Myxococcota bacterium]
MALIQATEPTTQTALSGAIATEYLHRRKQTLPVDPLVGLMIAGVIPLTLQGTNSLTWQSSIENEFTGVATVAENDAAPEESLTATQVQVSGAKYGLRSFVLDNAIKLAGMGVKLTDVSRRLKHAHANYWHQQILALFTSITAAGASADTDAMTLLIWDANTASFRATPHDSGQLWAVLHNTAHAQLRSDLRQNAAALYGSAFGDAAARQLLNTKQGMGVPFDGYMLYESVDVPTSGAGVANALGVGSPGMQENAGIVRPVWEKIDFEGQRDAGRFGLWIVSGLTAGVGIAKQANLRRFLSNGD